MFYSFYPQSPPNLNGQVSEENSSTVEVIEQVTIAVAAAQVNSDSSALQLVVCPAPIDAQPRIPSLHWFLLSVVFNVAFLACLILLLDKKVFNNIAPAFMAYKKKWAVFHFGFIITGNAICYSLYAILISVLNKATGLWVGFLVNMAYGPAHEVVLYRTKDIILAHLVFSFHGCSFICFMKYLTPQDNKIQLIQACTMDRVCSLCTMLLFSQQMDEHWLLPFHSFYQIPCHGEWLQFYLSFSSFYLCCMAYGFVCVYVFFIFFIFYFFVKLKYKIIIFSQGEF